MRGIVLDRFFKAAPEDVSWISKLDGLSEENALKIITDSVEWWNQVISILKILQTHQKPPQSFDDMLEQFKKATEYAKEKINNNALTKNKSITLETPK